MTHTLFSLYSPKGRVASATYSFGKKETLTYDQLVIGFSVALAEFMLNNDEVTESEIFASIIKIKDALSNVSFREITR